MSPTTARVIRMILSALIAGIIGANGVLLAANGVIDKKTLVFAALTGATLMCQDLKSYLSTAPIAAPTDPLH